MTRRALVTGAGGFLGGHVLEALLEQTSWDVVALDSFRHNGTVDRLYDALELDLTARTLIVPHDLRVPFSTRELDFLEGVNVIFNLASRSSVDESIADPYGFVVNNVAATLTALELARMLRVRRFVHMSTDEVFGQCDGVTINCHGPSSPYAASKAAQEDVCHAYARTYGLPITIVTSANMFGERQSQLAFLPKIVRKLLREEVVEVHTYGGVPGSRRYSYVGDVARWVVAVVNAAEVTGGDPPARVVLPGRYEVGNLELVERVASVLDRPHAVELVEAAVTRPGADPRYPNLDVFAHGDWLHPDVLARESLDDRLGRAVRWFAAYPDWLAST